MRRPIFDRVKQIEITTEHDERLRQCLDNTLDVIADITSELAGKESLNLQRALFHEVLLYFIKNLCSNSIEAWNIYTEISSLNPKLKTKRNPRNSKHF